jgi:hypothetical protein
MTLPLSVHQDQLLALIAGLQMALDSVERLGLREVRLMLHLNCQQQLYLLGAQVLIFLFGHFGLLLVTTIRRTDSLFQ